MEQQIIDVLNQYVAYDRFVNDQHYLMKTEITSDKACVVQFTTEQGNVMTTSAFFQAVISEESKK